MISISQGCSKDEMYWLSVELKPQEVKSLKFILLLEILKYTASQVPSRHFTDTISFTLQNNHRLLGVTIPVLNVRGRLDQRQPEGLPVLTTSGMVRKCTVELLPIFSSLHLTYIHEYSPFINSDILAHAVLLPEQTRKLTLKGESWDWVCSHI